MAPSDTDGESRPLLLEHVLVVTGNAAFLKHVNHLHYAIRHNILGPETCMSQGCVTMGSDVAGSGVTGVTDICDGRCDGQGEWPRPIRWEHMLLGNRTTVSKGKLLRLNTRIGSPMQQLCVTCIVKERTLVRTEEA